MLIQLIIFLSGIAVLYTGGVLFIRGSSNTARIFRIRPLIIGTVIIAFATSAPEFCVSILAVIRQSRTLAIGNIVGSCICNIGMVLGLSALIRPVRVGSSVLRREMPILLAATIMLFLACIDLKIDRFEAGIFIIGFFLFISYSIRNAKKAGDASPPSNRQPVSKTMPLVYLGIGLTGLLAGAYIVVNAAVNLAGYLGISELVIGLSVVAVGTSLPELFVSAIASWKAEGDISIGNVIGSNLFNILCIIGIVCLIRPVFIDRSVLMLSMPFLLVYVFVLVPIIRTDYRISRVEGMLLFASYLFYLNMLLKI